MQFTDVVNWNLADFIIMGTLLLSTLLMINLALRRFGKYRVVVVIAIMAVFLFIWAEIAVGIFTNLDR